MKTETRSIVVSRNKSTQLIIFTAIIFCIALAFYLGGYQKRVTVADLMDENTVLERELLEVTELLNSAEKTIDILEVDNEVNSIALENSRLEILDLQRIISDNTFQLEVYKDYLSDDFKAKKKLFIASFSASEIKQNVWSYSWITVQSVKQPKISSVVLKAFIVGEMEGISEELPFDELDEYLPRFPLDLRVKYFSSTKGKLSFPEGFTPKQVKFMLHYAQKPSEIYETNFEWSYGV